MSRARARASLALLFLVVLCGTGDGQAASVGGWLKITSTGGRCAHGDPYAFWFHRGSPTKLLLFFQGGGGCWSFATCAPGSTFYRAYLQSPTSPPLAEGGIIDFSDPRNPFRNYSIAFLAYCTGDVHWGNHVQTYGDGRGHRLVIRHVGFDNDRRALAWVFARFPAPTTVFVTGCSAGSVGSAVFAPYVIRSYPDAIVNQLGDSLALVLPRKLDIRSGWRGDRALPAWIPAMRRLNPARMTLADYYVALANFYPGHTFAQFDHEGDWVQARYYVALGGRWEAFPGALARTLQSIHDRARTFRSYVADGDGHCVLPDPSFYSLDVAGKPLREWVADLAEGRPVANVAPSTHQ
jgi:Pectinacetylesterase